MSKNYSGQLLIAHPALQDPNFFRTVVLVSAHSEEDGTLGVILNRPMHKTLGEVDPDFAYGPLADIPLFRGGPVSGNEMILTAWYWEEETHIFRLFFGIDQEKATEIRAHNPQAQFRGFIGYSGWGKGQLELEISQNSWVLSPLLHQTLDLPDGERGWRQTIMKASPELGFLANLPEDPSLN